MQGAEDFRSAKRQRDDKPSKQPVGKRSRGVAFGSGVMDEDDVYGMTDDYVMDHDSRQGYNYDLQSDEEDGSPKQWATSRHLYSRL